MWFMKRSYIFATEDSKCDVHMKIGQTFDKRKYFALKCCLLCFLFYQLYIAYRQVDR